MRSPGTTFALELLDDKQRAAILEAKQRLFELGAEQVVLFGSAVQGLLEDESDLDLLVVFPTPVSLGDRDAVSDVVFEVNLRHDTNLSSVVVDRPTWDSEAFRSLSIHGEIASHGILV